MHCSRSLSLVADNDSLVGTPPVPSLFLLNAIVLSGGVIAFLIAGFAGALLRRLRPWRYRLLLVPLGFVVYGGIAISAEQHLLRWIHHGQLQHSFGSGVAQSIVLLVAGLCGLLSGLGLGTSLDASFSAPADTSQPSSLHIPAPRPRKATVVSISRGRSPGVLPHIKASSDHE
jgi:hypothetical protein